MKSVSMSASSEPPRFVLCHSLAQLFHGGSDRRDDVVHLDDLLDVGFAQDQGHGRENSDNVAGKPLNVGLIGLGTVGAQVADRMLTWGPQLSRRAGVELCLKRVLVRD